MNVQVPIYMRAISDACAGAQINGGNFWWLCRCPTYTDLPAECTLGPDPADPLCCQRPLCQFVPQPNKTEGYLIPPLRPGVLTGGSVTPTPLPYFTPTPGPDGSTLEPPRPTPEPKSKTVCSVSPLNLLFHSVSPLNSQWWKWGSVWLVLYSC